MLDVQRCLSPLQGVAVTDELSSKSTTSRGVLGHARGT